MIDNYFLWEDEDNYNRRETFCGISRPQDSDKGLTNTVDTFEQFFDKDMAQKIATHINRYAGQLKIQGAICPPSGRG